MEQKRILWITAAVGTFLLVVIGAALILYSPSQQKSSVTVGEPAIASIQMTGDTWVRGGSSNSETASTSQTVPLPSSASTVQADSVSQIAQAQAAANQVADKTSAVTDINGKDITVISGTTHVYSSGTTTTIDLNALKNGGTAQITTVNNQVEPAVEKKQTASTAIVEAPAPAKNTTSVATPKPVVASASSAKKETVKTTTKTTMERQYWVQAASFTSKKNAEEARSALTAAEITGEIFTYQNEKGDLFYRVRVGPYTTSSEAEYWKARIVKIDMFMNSQCYVTNTSVASIK